MTQPLPYHGLARLMTRTYHGEDLTELGQALIQQSTRSGSEGAAEALLDLAILLHLKGFHEMARDIQMQGLRQRQSYVIPANGAPTAMRLLMLMVPGELNANTPVEFLVQDSDVELQQLYIGRELPFPDEIPEHDVAMVAVGESEDSLALLAALGKALVHWPRPVINHPERIAALARDSLVGLLQGVEGLALPPTFRINRATIETWAGLAKKEHGLVAEPDYPVIVRPVDSHAGRGLVKVETAGAWKGYLAAQPEDVFFVSPFVDYRSADGLFRKYRVALVDGVPFAGHMAISAHWMVHYLNGGMTESEEKRIEEARFMEHFDREFGKRHLRTLQQIHQRLGLDYVVLDCAETPDGHFLLFEADSSAVVHAMDPVTLFPYKHPAMAKVFAAFRALLDRARARPSGLVG